MSGSNSLVRTGKRFSSKAVGFLAANAGKMSVKSIANRLRRTPKSVSRKAEKLGISLRLAR
jgi:hypothetical protein